LFLKLKINFFKTKKKKSSLTRHARQVTNLNHLGYNGLNVHHTTKMHANSHVQFDTCIVSYTCQIVRHVHFDKRDTRVKCACDELHNLTRVWNTRVKFDTCIPIVVSNCLDTCILIHVSKQFDTCILIHMAKCFFLKKKFQIQFFI
jgi:hypothetical protein